VATNILGENSAFVFRLKIQTLCSTETPDNAKMVLSCINLLSLAVSLLTTRFNIKKLYMVLALPLVFCMDLRTDSNYCFIHILLTGFYNRGGKRLQRGTD
jgi:hypothetical protein